MEELRSFFRVHLAPFLLVFLCPPGIILLERFIVDSQGSFSEFLTQSKGLDGLAIWFFTLWFDIIKAVSLLFPYGLGISTFLYSAKSKLQLLQYFLIVLLVTFGILLLKGEEILPILNISTHTTDDTAFRIIFGFSAFQILLLKYVPGPDFIAPITPHGNQPVYRDNGLACMFITFVAFFVFSMKSSPFYFFAPSIVFTHFRDIVAACNVISLTLCLLLNVKGRYNPTNEDVAHNPFIFSYYWGIELHPVIFTINVKQFTNCRFGMMAWPFIILSFAFGQQEKFGGTMTDAMFLNVFLQWVYVIKFFYWEAGYCASMDMTTDRAGFYICWGCITWLPTLYTSHSLFTACFSAWMGNIPFTLNLIAGLACIWFNYEADAQRKLVRDTNGKCLIWGKPPVLIQAQYTTGNGKTHKSILLVSGFWGMSRHAHYLFEISAAFFWSLPGSFSCNCYAVAPYFYVIFLTILLVDRSFRDDKQCAIKYTKYWDEYRLMVPYKIIPGVF